MKVVIVNAAAGTDVNANYIISKLQEKCDGSARFDLCSLDFDPTYPIRKNDGVFKEDSVEEDLREAFKSVYESDLIIFLSPNYFNFVSGVAKQFLDKFFTFYNSSHMPVFESEKKMFFILTQASQNRGDGQIAQDWMKRFSENFRIKFFGITVPGSAGKEPDGAKLKMDEIIMSFNMFKG